MSGYSEEYSFALYGYWRSSASWRVRTVLNLYNIPYEYRVVNLLKGEQKSSEFVDGISPNAVIPALAISKKSTNEPVENITQSLAIIEFLDNYHNGSSKLVPSNPFKKARVQEISLSIACDIHPVQNLRVLQSYAEENRANRAKEVITNGLRAIEKLIAKKIVGEEERTHWHYCVGEDVTLADIVLVPQVYNGYRFQVDMSEFPRIVSIYEHLSTLPAFIASHPDQQPDAPKTA